MASQLAEPMLENLNVGAGLLAGNIESLQNYYDALAPGLPGNVFMADLNFKGLFCNKKFQDFAGLESREGYVGFGVKDYISRGILSPKAADILEGKLLEIPKTKKMQLNVKEPPAKTIKGKDVRLITSRFPIYDQSGEMIAIFGNTVDIDELDFTTEEQSTFPKITLSFMQKKVLAFYNKGVPHKEAAWQLDIAVTTYAWHLRQIREKYGIRTRREMLELEQGL